MPSSYTVIERRTRLPVSAAEAFAWHERPGALERLTPPWEHLEVVERTGGLEDGARVVTRVRVGPLALRWVAVHRDHVPGRQFADEQAEGPFSHWRHLHRFDPEGPGTSTATDRIEFSPPFGTVGAAGGLWVARPRIERMLAYRHRLLPADLAAHARFPGRAGLRIAITGASGLVGSALRPFLTTGGHRVTAVVRGAPRPGEIGWDPGTGRVETSALEGLDAVVHLAGENVGARWTPERKRRIAESRVRGTRILAEALAGLRQPPKVLVAASGIGIYGNRGSEVLTEDSAIAGAAADFLADVGREWEAAAEPARAAGIRVVHLRFGVILTPAGGALGRMLPAFRLGAGGPLASGRQWMSWVAIDDAVGAIHQALLSDKLAGPVNVVAPEPVTNREFATTLGRVLRRPSFVPVPAAALRLIFGEMADGTLLSSARVLPDRLGRSGYPFRFPTLRSAFGHLLGEER